MLSTHDIHATSECQITARQLKSPHKLAHSKLQLGRTSSFINTCPAEIWQLPIVLEAGWMLPVVVSQLLTRLDVCACKEDEAALSFHLKHLGVHAGRTAVILQRSKHCLDTFISDMAVLLLQCAFD